MEDLQTFFSSTLNDSYWDNIERDFPRHEIDETRDNSKCTEFILSSMKEKYPEKDWDEIEHEMMSIIDKYIISFSGKH